MPTEAQKRAAAKWQANNMKMVAVKLKREEADAFEAACARAGTTRMAVLRQAVRDYLAAQQAAETADTATTTED